MVSFFLIADWPEQAKFLTAEEKALIVYRLANDGNSGVARMDKLNSGSLKRIFRDWKIWCGQVDANSMSNQILTVTERSSTFVSQQQDMLLLFSFPRFSTSSATRPQAPNFTRSRSTVWDLSLPSSVLGGLTAYNIVMPSPSLVSRLQQLATSSSFAKVLLRCHTEDTACRSGSATCPSSSSPVAIILLSHWRLSGLLIT